MGDNIGTVITASAGPATNPGALSQHRKPMDRFRT